MEIEYINCSWPDIQDTCNKLVTSLREVTDLILKTQTAQQPRRNSGEPLIEQKPAQMSKSFAPLSRKLKNILSLELNSYSISYRQYLCSSEGL